MFVEQEMDEQSRRAGPVGGVTVAPAHVLRCHVFPHVLCGAPASPIGRPHLTWALSCSARTLTVFLQTNRLSRYPGCG